jgi:uncharacterized RDD family membrane protein YckC
VARDHGRSPFRAAGRLALFPARAAAKASRSQIEGAADEHLVPELSRLADRAFAGQLPEELARSIAEHHVLERVARELAATGALDTAVDRALADERTKAIVDRIVKSDEVRQAIRDVVASPEVREALTEQSMGLVEELATDLRRSAAAHDDRIEAVVRRPPRSGRSRYAGLASRALAFSVDLLAIAAVYAVIAGLLALISYLVGGLRPAWLAGTILGVGFLVVGWAYFVVFWTDAGRTPGMHLVRLRVRDREGKSLSFGRAVVRAVATWISIVPFFLGYITVLFDERRRGLPDLVAGTEVVHDDSSR